MEKSYSILFRTFFKIGLTTFGGGHALIPIIKSNVVTRYRWMDRRQFNELITIAGSCPGAMIINASILIGYRLRKTKGSLTAVLGALLPSFLFMLVFALIYHLFDHNRMITAMFRGIRPAIVALLVIPTFNLAKSAHITWANCWIPAGGALLIWILGVNPIWIIIAAGIGGFIYGKFIQPTEK
ncbi:MAG: chromate transporter [Prevotella sp.]|jgi:chromate transporter|nr:MULTISPECIES: chromate transporter [unclassified Prevotella]MCH3970173.1 chromate transporter [Prevotella sp.]MCH3992466.1 chromate transporter [Prevotella sp.]MCH4186235.1 chromate transporter [Prevotella sp.]MCH4216420.1 chromate transporter [Prevotella sp.]MCH4252289.1 chromate transporter [Prevotella sp.]